MPTQWTVEGIEPPPIYRRKDDKFSGQVQSSADMRAQLAAEGKPVIVAFSRGKDSICVLISLLAAGVECIPVHLYRVPGLQFEEESIEHFQEVFGTRIWNLPHPDFYYYLEAGIAQPPERNSIIEASGINDVPYDLMWSLFKESLGLHPETWIANGVRAADSPNRRMAILQHGPWTSGVVQAKTGNYSTSVRTQTAMTVWDWKIADIRKCLEINNIDLPIDYELFGRTFDGIDYRFVAPLREAMPAEYARILEWFPFVQLEVDRYESI